jgi:plasmid stabilization system protein ParE
VFVLEWTERARLEYYEAITYLADKDPAAADRVQQRLLRAMENLETFSLGLPAPAGTWRVFVPKTSYFIIFRRDKSGSLMICGFVHAARDWERIDWEDF